MTTYNILPGFQDTHVHVIEGGLSESGVECFMLPNKSAEEYVAALVQCAETQKDSEWVRATGATLYNLRAADPSPITLLDKAIPNRPVLVLDDLGHAAWVNSLALNLSGIAEDAEDPPGGVYERSPITGNLSGLLLENAQQVTRDAAKFDAETLYNALLLGLDFVASKGVTSVSDAGVYWTRGHVEAWQRAEKEGTLTARASNALYLYPDHDYNNQLKALTELYSNVSNSLLKFDTIKAYADGILDLGTAALLQPALEPIDTSLPDGLLYFTPEKLANYTKDLAALGFKFHYHAVGDRAVRVSLDALEELPTVDRVGRAHRTTHTYLVHADDYNRFKSLDVFADLQMAAGTLNPAYQDDMFYVIGEKSYQLLPLKPLVAAGAMCSLSSDWDADPLDPMGTLNLAINRPYPEDSISLEDAVAMATLEAAAALSQDAITGSIEVGKFADFVVLDSNIFDVVNGNGTLTDVSVLQTVLAGLSVYTSTECGDRCLDLPNFLDSP